MLAISKIKSKNLNLRLIFLQKSNIKLRIRFKLFEFNLFTKKKITLIDIFQEIRNFESEKLIKKNNLRVLIKIYILTKE